MLSVDGTVNCIGSVILWLIKPPGHLVPDITAFTGVCLIMRRCSDM
jgi:hypothetical protein